MSLTHEFDDLIRAARVQAMYVAQFGRWQFPGGMPFEMPEGITDTERWEWPLISHRRDGVWTPELDPGRALFYAEPLLIDDMRTDMPVSSKRVLVCATEAEMRKLFTGDLPLQPIRWAIDHENIVSAEIARCTTLAAFWPTFLGHRYYLDPMGRSLPRLVVATRNMDNHTLLGSDTFDVGGRLLDITGQQQVTIRLINVR